MIKSILLPINIAWFLNFIYNITIETEFITGNETLWSSQKVIAEIFGTTSANISMHFSNIIQEGELDEKEVSISSKDLFKDNPNFIKKSLKKSNNLTKIE